MNATLNFSVLGVVVERGRNSALCIARLYMLPVLFAKLMFDVK